MRSFTGSMAVLASAMSLTLAQGSINPTLNTKTIVGTYTSTNTTNVPVTTTQTLRGLTSLPLSTTTSTTRTVVSSTQQFTQTVSQGTIETVNITSTYKPTTDTITITSTVVLVDVTNSTSIQYINSTQTIGNTVYGVTTTTVPTPDGFVPVDTSANQTNYMMGGARRRSEEEVALEPRQDTSVYTFTVLSISTRLVPISTTVQTVTSTKTVRTKAATVTVAVTTTFNNTIGVPDTPVKTNTTTFVTTRMNMTNTIVVPMETVVATSYTNATNYTSTSTSYAACATNNLLGPQLKNANYISKVTDLNDNAFSTDKNATSSSDCCAMCQTGGCDFAQFNTKTNKCTIYAPASSTNGSATCSHSTAGYFNAAKAVSDLVVINGPCGQLVQGKPAARSASG